MHNSSDGCSMLTADGGDEAAAAEEARAPQQRSHAAATSSSLAAAQDGQKRLAFYAQTPDGTRFSAGSFSDLHLSRPLLKACTVLGYTSPTPIQVYCSTGSICSYRCHLSNVWSPPSVDTVPCLIPYGLLCLCNAPCDLQLSLLLHVYGVDLLPGSFSIRHSNISLWSKQQQTCMGNDDMQDSPSTAAQQ